METLQPSVQVCLLFLHHERKHHTCTRLLSRMWAASPFAFGQQIERTSVVTYDPQQEPGISQAFATCSSPTTAYPSLSIAGE